MVSKAHRLVPLGALVACVACGVPAEEGEDASTGSSSAATETTISSDSTTADPGLDSSGEPAACMPVVDFETRPTAELIDGGTRLRLLPSGLRLEVPEGWDASGFLLTEEELAMAENGEGEWTTELAAVANPLLDFHSCAAHFGPHPWDSNVGTFFVRAYVHDEPAAEIEARISAEGSDLAAAVGGMDPVVEQDLTGSWRRTRLSFDLWFGDYGGEASLDYRIREQAGVTLVFLFMEARFAFGSEDGLYADEIAMILDSVCLPDMTTDVCCE